MDLRMPERRRARQASRSRQRRAGIIRQVALAKQDVCRRTDRELGELSRSIRHRPSYEEDWISYAPQALALVSEATRRNTGIDVTEGQLLAGISLLDGAIAELREGEGKGIAAILAAYVSVLSGMKVHVVTRSEYLARRDLIRAQSILGSLGIGTNLVGNRLKEPEVTFGSYSGYVADYLEENMTIEAGDRIEKERDFAIVDEADTILIDEARCLVQIRAESTTGEASRPQIMHLGPNCNEASVVEGRSVLAECRIRNYFGAYRKLAGLTATAMPAAPEFKHFYGLEIISVPASVSTARIDHEDLWYAGTERMLADLELNALDRHNRGQPVFIRADSEGMCREISQRLAGRGVAHSVLWPGDDRASAKIMAEAGEYHAVTITVGSSGRGYGIRLGGDISYAAEEHAFGGEEEADLSAASSRKLQEARNAVRDEIEANRGRAVAAGGLVVLCALRSGSARADDWLRGLAGQRGEPGESRFYISSEEYALSLPRNGALIREETKRNSPPMVVNRSLRGRFFQSMINDIYSGTEAASFALRRKLAEFDDLVHVQQEQAYAFRNSILLNVSSDEIITWVTDMLKSICIDQSAGSIRNFLEALYPVRISEAEFDEILLHERLKRLAGAAELVSTDMHAAISSRAREVGYDHMCNSARRVGLSSFDRRWSTHLSAVREFYGRIPLDDALVDSASFEDFRRSISTEFEDIVMCVRRDTAAGLFF